MSAARPKCWPAAAAAAALSLLAACSRPLPPGAATGPYLLWANQSILVRYQPPPTSSAVPSLEVADRSNEVHTRPLSRQADGFWQAALPEKSGGNCLRYRILAGGEKTAWFPLPCPAPGEPFTFAVLGDRYGYLTPGESAAIARRYTALTRLIANDRPEIILQVGDMVDDGQHRQEWLDSLQQAAPLVSGIPLAPVPGNHGVSRENIFASFFPLGRCGNAYSFTYGPAHFIALDSNDPLDPGSRQYDFLVQQLRQFQKQGPIFVFLHHPIYSFSRHGGTPLLRRYLAPLFEKYGVRAVFSGHDHNYQRIEPIGGVTYFVSGGGGAPLYEVKAPTAGSPLKAAVTAYHYLLLRVDRREIRGEMKDLQGTVQDRFALPLATPLP